jgi:hypothetical protein
MEGEYCCMAHRHMGLGNASAAEMHDPKAPRRRSWQDTITFPNYDELWDNCTSWIKANGSCANKGPISGMWFNECMRCMDCPARQTFDKAANKVELTDWDEGEFGWHGTRSLDGLQAICWENWSPARRSGQACGPGEYFSRGTPQGLHYSEGYAGGDAGHLLVIAWIMSHEKGAKPQNPSANGACASTSAGHIVCNNPVDANRQSTGEMYCFPVGVAAFGYGGRKPCFKLTSSGQISKHPSGVIVVERKEVVVAGTGASSQCCTIL